MAQRGQQQRRKSNVENDAREVTLNDERTGCRSIGDWRRAVNVANATDLARTSGAVVCITVAVTETAAATAAATEAEQKTVTAARIRVCNQHATAVKHETRHGANHLCEPMGKRNHTK